MNVKILFARSSSNIFLSLKKKFNPTILLVPEEKHDFANLTFSDFFMKFFGEKFGQIFFWSKNENKEKKINQNFFSS